MDARDPNREQSCLVAEALGDLREDVVFVGGATVGLLITDQAAPTVRPTKDVDVVIEVASYADYQLTIVPRLRESGFRESTEPEAPISVMDIPMLCFQNSGMMRLTRRNVKRMGRSSHRGHRRTGLWPQRGRLATLQNVPVRRPSSVVRRPAAARQSHAVAHPAASTQSLTSRAFRTPSACTPPAASMAS